eukprot:TRINITY_DN8177_c0_g2_i1.p1 TRINITY_DN8177_c0_g2~~TRINITY_DN8177_c0_g2_i1.p1  ORF type:complete len:502 (+),score=139.24 TRINITY_DN8177_c0_g2_i1:225-1730(+)
MELERSQAGSVTPGPLRNHMLVVASEEKLRKKETEARQEARAQMLRDVFAEFDLDRSGSVETRELLELGSARRMTGQKQTEWTPEKNRRFLNKLDIDRDGRVSLEEFVEYFGEHLPYDEATFNEVVADFMEVARFVRMRQKAKVEEEKRQIAAEQEAEQRRAADMAAQEEARRKTQMEVEAARAAKFEQERQESLRAVFKEFDLDGSGTVTVEELLELGTARRTTGQRGGTWGPEQNQRLVDALDTDGDGTVSATEFVRHFNKVLPQDHDGFRGVVKDFLEVARVVRRSKSKQQSQSQELSRVEMQRTIQLAEQAGRERSERRKARDRKLMEVFALVELDESGSIEAGELLELGEARRRVQHKTGQWTTHENQRLVDKVDVDGDGTVSCEEFVAHFSESLPHDLDSFNREIQKFMDVAMMVRSRRQREREAAAGSPNPSDNQTEPETTTPELMVELKHLRETVKYERQQCFMMAVALLSLFLIWYLRHDPCCSCSGRGPLH